MNRFIVLALASTLALGCANIREQKATINDLGVGCAKAMDIYTGKWFWERLIESPHRFDIWRDEKGNLQVRPATGSSSSMLQALEGAASTASVISVGSLLMAKKPHACD